MGWGGSGRGKSWTYHNEDNDRFLNGNHVLSGNLSGNHVLSGNTVSVGDVSIGNAVDSFNGGNIVTTILGGGFR